jgi:hypothetical protein
VSALLIDRLPVFLRQYIRYQKVDTTNDEAVQKLANIIIDQVVDEVCDTEPGMPVTVGTALRVTAREVALELWTPGWRGVGSLRLHPAHTEAEFRAVVASAIRAMQRDAAEVRQ